MTLEPQITVRNMEPVPELEAAVLKEIGTLERFFKRIMSCRVMIEGPKGRRYGGLYHVRIDLGVPNEELVVEHQPSLHATLQDEKALRKTKQDEPGRVHRDALRAVHDAFREMRRRLQDYVRRVRGDVKAREAEVVAKVTRLFPDYGFIETPDGREVYFHRNSVRNGHFDLLRAGSEVRFVEEAGEKGPQASTVTLLRPAAQARDAAKTDAFPPVKPARRKAG